MSGALIGGEALVVDDWGEAILFVVVVQRPIDGDDDVLVLIEKLLCAI